MKTRLLLILGLALALRLVFFALVSRNPVIVTSSPDSQRYLTTASSLSNNHVFSTAGHPETRQTPGYPLFLALCGVSDRNSYQVAQIVQILLDVLLVFVTFRIAAGLFGPGPALLAALFQAISPLAIYSSVAILTDSLFALLVGVIVWLFVFRIDRGYRFIVVAALLSAAATWVRPVGFFLLPAETLVLCMSPRRVARVVVFALVFLIALAPWYVRNAFVLGYHGFSSQSEYNLFNYEAAAVRATTSGESLDRARVELQKQYRNEASRLGIQPNTAEAFKLQRDIALSVLRAAPARFVLIHLKDSLVTLLPGSTEIMKSLGVTTGRSHTLSVIQKGGPLAAVRNYFRGNPLAALLLVPELVFMIVCYGGFIVWAREAFRDRSVTRPAVVLIALLIPIFIFVGGAGSVPRYRLPIEALINCGAGAGIALNLRRFGWIRSKG